MCTELVSVKFYVIPPRYLLAANNQRDDDCQASASMMSSQCPDTGIQKKEWCHASSLLLLSCK
ncbi:hypothetical protein [Wolbachia endosymbiont of Psylliodes chrysocephala]|uniref:hypothetical protein n=1 Tax=Wolbachia endosymbiont of Psylliodes chrysocephala TaxID=2883236 RepID=UPI00209EEF34|nr:hypothetical protein [Wolbachia endosymbiont of Psylliodes chrysocephala]